MADVCQIATFSHLYGSKGRVVSRGLGRNMIHRREWWWPNVSFSSRLCEVKTWKHTKTSLQNSRLSGSNSQEEPVTSWCHRILNPALSWSTRINETRRLRLVALVFTKTENYPVSVNENLIILQVLVSMWMKRACVPRFKCSPAKIHLVQTFRSQSIWNRSCSSAGAAGIKDSYGYIWWERSTPLLSCIRRSD